MAVMAVMVDKVELVVLLEVGGKVVQAEMAILMVETAAMAEAVQPQVLLDRVELVARHSLVQVERAAQVEQVQ
jgi:hypothetical protein